MAAGGGGPAADVYLGTGQYSVGSFIFRAASRYHSIGTTTANGFPRDVNTVCSSISIDADSFPIIRRSS
jgi:hypothetical protein